MLGLLHRSVLGGPQTLPSRCSFVTDNEVTCELLDGNITTVGAKHPRCVEVLFQPSPL